VLRAGDSERGGVVASPDAAGVMCIVAHVTRWMTQQPRKATCHGRMTATSNKMRSIDRIVFLLIPE
jgi:hypothetical protein